MMQSNGSIELVASLDVGVKRSEPLRMARKQVLTVIDLRHGTQIGKQIKVTTPELWVRSDTELKKAIKAEGTVRPPTHNYAKINSACKAIGWQNVAFTREWLE